MRILFVCTGNTCRSPLAEAILRRLLEQRGKRTAGIEVLSAGISGFSGNPAAEQARIVARERAMSLDKHTSQVVTPALVESADLVLTMTQQQRESLVQKVPQHAAKIRTLSSYAGFEGDIDDPFGGTVETYRKCADDLEILLAQVAKGLDKPDHEEDDVCE